PDSLPARGPARVPGENRGNGLEEEMRQVNQRPTIPRLLASALEEIKRSGTTPAEVARTLLEAHRRKLSSKECSDLLACGLAKMIGDELTRERQREAAEKAERELQEIRCRARESIERERRERQEREENWHRKEEERGQLCRSRKEDIQRIHAPLGCQKKMCQT